MNLRTNWNLPPQRIAYTHTPSPNPPPIHAHINQKPTHTPRTKQKLNSAVHAMPASTPPATRSLPIKPVTTRRGAGWLYVAVGWLSAQAWIGR